MSYTVRRDSYGIPHIEADSLEELFEGQGYATAQDRLWHMEWDRRRAAGTTAALTGQRAHVASDAFSRRARLGDFARSGFAKLSAQTQRICEMHAAGVNRWIAECTLLPSQFDEIEAPRPEPFEAWEAVAIFLIRHVTFATWQTKLWNTRVLAALGADAVPLFRSEGRGGQTPVIVPPGVRAATGALVDAGLFADSSAVLEELAPLGLQMSGSNAWLVDGTRSATGLPLVAGDPHRPYETPNVYYQIGLRCIAAGIDAAGISFPGIPGVPHFGQNERTAWAVTNAMADYQDLYVERLPSASLDTRIETIEVRGAPSVTVECSLTRHGPIVIGSSAHGVGVALQSAGLSEAGRSLEVVVSQLQAGKVADLDACLADWVEPANNFLMADVDGTVAYRTGGWIPVRSKINAWLAVPGWSDDHEWRGFIADADLPRTKDPDIGAIVTANQRVASRDYPHFLGVDAYAGQRAERIWVNLGDRRGLIEADMAAIHIDRVNSAGLRFAALAGGELAGWDGSMDVESRPAALYALAKDLLVKRLTEALPAQLRSNPFAEWEPPATAFPAALRVGNALDGWIIGDERRFLPDGLSWADVCRQALSDASAELGDRTWGDLHHYQPLRLGFVDRVDHGPIAGGADCVMATNQVSGVSTNALQGSTARYVWDLADRSRSGWVVPLGAHEDPSHPHHADQLEHYRSGRLLPIF